MNVQELNGDELRKEYHKLYMRRWRKNNRQKVKEYNDRYWHNKACVEVRSLCLEDLERESERLKQQA